MAVAKKEEEQIDISGPTSIEGEKEERLVASEVPFQDFCVLLEKVQSTSGTERKKNPLERFMHQWREVHGKLHPQGTAHTHVDSFYPAMRLLLPHLDRQRPAYGLKEVALAKQYIDILNIAKESSDAQKLLNYRTPHASKHDATDFAGVAYFVLRNRCPDKGSLTVAQVNQYLDQLALSNVTKDRAGVKKALQVMLRNTSAQEQKWLIRIIMKELKIGLSENSILTVFHPDALDLFSVSSSLEKVCIDLHDTSVRLNETAISYFTPFRPMLGQRATIEQVVKLMDHQPFFIENKFDGERMQLHKQHGQYRYYSRSSREYTSTFGRTESEGSFTPNIHKAFKSKVHSCILDGEMVGWDKENECYLPKGENIDVKTLAPVGEGGEGSIQPCYVVFDVLMINETNLANCPLGERVEHLNKIFEPVPGCLHKADRIEKSSKEDVIMALNEAIDRREEGLVIKQPSSLYKPDKRKGSGWLKIKPDYVDSLSDDLDLLIIGGYFGVGRRSGMVSHFMCGVAVPPTIIGDKPSVFHSFCKVGSGYTMNELRELGHKLMPHWKKFDTKRPPQSIILAPGFKEKPDLFIEPKHSKIVQIRAAEIVVSDKYKAGCTLRFPRLERVRDDKEWFDCMTVDELEDLKRVASGHLAHRHYDEDGEEGEGGLTTAKKKRRVTRVDRPRGVAAQFRQTDVSGVEEVSSIFAGKEFCVVNGTPTFSKQNIETKIAEHGGTFVQNPTDETYCVIVHKIVVKATNIINKHVYNVVRIQWFFDCLEAKKCLPLKPSLMLSTSSETASKFAEIYDKFGDSYIEDISETALREIFDKMTNPRSCAVDEIAKIELEFFPNHSEDGLFRQYKFYFDKYRLINIPSSVILNTSLELHELDARLYGATVSHEFNDTVTHVVFDKNDLKRVSQLRSVQKSHTRKSHFVLSEWISACIEEKRCKNERHFEPVT